MSENIKLCAIVAMAENRVIGRDNGLIWHISEDLKHFKRITMGKPIIMGRKSYDSIGKPLPGRANIVISRSTSSVPTEDISGNNGNAPFSTGVYYVNSVRAGIELGKDIAAREELDEIFITGGGQIYAETLPQVERLYLTIVHKDYEGDTYFPILNWDEWDIVFDEKHEASKKTPSFTFMTLERK